MTSTSSGSSELTVANLTKAQRRKLQSLCREDEINATVGVLNMLTTAIIAVKWPAHYWIWHLARTAFYIPTRFLRFRKKKWELYLLDWCYVVTYISTICSVLAFVRVTFGISTVLVRYNADFIHAGSAMAGGPLAWSVFVFRNSVVFHDVDHSTSVFIHLSPVVLFWCLRWGAGQPSVVEETWPGMFKVCDTNESFLAADDCMRSWQGMLWCNACSASWSAFVIPPALLYLFVWSGPYFVIIMVWCHDWCERTGRETLYTYFCQSQSELMDRCQRPLVPIVGKRYAGPLGYMLLHLVTMLVFCSTSYLLWHSFLLHTLLIIIVLVKAVDNGSTYMFRVFAYRYAQERLRDYKDKLD